MGGDGNDLRTMANTMHYCMSTTRDGVLYSESLREDVRATSGDRVGIEGGCKGA